LERWVFGDERKKFMGGNSKPAAKKPAPAPATTKDEDDSDSIPF
jgi:hypothetical protein